MTRDWLKAEVDVMVAAYKADDWNGVHASIRRMLDFNAGGSVRLTREEAALAARDLRTVALLAAQGTFAPDVQRLALAERLEAAA